MTRDRSYWKYTTRRKSVPKFIATARHRHISRLSAEIGSNLPQRQSLDFFRLVIESKFCGAHVALSWIGTDLQVSRRILFPIKDF